MASRAAEQAEVEDSVSFHGSSAAVFVEIPLNTEHGIEGEQDDDGDRAGTLAVAGGKSGNLIGVELDRSCSPNCPVCFEPWTSEGPHRVCCFPCGHLYGRSCLEKWVQLRRRNTGKCPTCNRKFKQKEIINIYAPIIAVQNDELEKELCTLREKNELLQSEKAHLIEEMSNPRKHKIDQECSDRPCKIPCLDHILPLPGEGARMMLGSLDDRIEDATSRVAASEARIESLSARISQIEQTQAEHKTMLDNLDGRLTRMEQRLTVYFDDHVGVIEAHDPGTVTGTGGAVIEATYDDVIDATDDELGEDDDDDDDGDDDDDDDDDVADDEEGDVWFLSA